jgi:hypothetical protein
MKHLKKFNETIIDDVESKEMLVSGQKRYSNLKYGYIDDSLVIESKPGIKTISFQTGEKGIDISDISKIEDIITFLMTEKDKLI